MSDIVIYIALFTWLYFGMCGLWEMWRFHGIPPTPGIWAIAVLTSLLAVLGPVFMQAVYESIIEELKESEQSNE